MTGGGLDKRSASSKRPVGEDWLNRCAFAYPGDNAASQGPGVSAKPAASETNGTTGDQSPKDINGDTHGGGMTLDDVLKAALTGDGKFPGKLVGDGESKWITPNENPH